MVEVGDRTLDVRAEELSADEAAAFWPRLLQVAPDYARYPKRTSRRIRLMRLVPSRASALRLLGPWRARPTAPNSARGHARGEHDGPCRWGPRSEGAGGCGLEVRRDAEIAQAIGTALADRGLDVAVAPPDEVRTIEGYDAAVLGSAVYAGHWLDDARQFVDRFRDAFATRPVWLFSSGPVGEPSRTPGRGILAATRARGQRVFAGRLERENLGIAQRAALALFRRLVEGGFRDWTAIRAWAEDIAEQLAVPASAMKQR